jgi:hypothetical protein
MKINERDKRALILLAVAAVIIVFWRFGSGTESLFGFQTPAASIPILEQRLQQLRVRTARIPMSERNVEQLRQALSAREEGLITADTAQQAQASLLAIVRDVLESQQPPIDPGRINLVSVERLTDHYAEAKVAVNFECRIEDLVNLLADFSRQPKLLATDSITVNSRNEEKKTLSVRLMISGLIPAELAPEGRRAGQL